MTRRGVSRLVIALGLGATSASQAQNSIVGRWEVRHGQLGHVYVFGSDGRYSYQRYTALLPGASQQVVGGETGNYALRGSQLVLRPNQGAQRTLRWRVGCGPGANPVLLPSECALFITSPEGSEEMFVSG
jgi:hypothetical protein